MFFIKTIKITRERAFTKANESILKTRMKERKKEENKEFKKLFFGCSNMKVIDHIAVLKCKLKKIDLLIKYFQKFECI